LKKTGLLNREMSSLISRLGHQDQICVSDAGLAIPDSLNIIDVSLKDNFPGVLDVLRIIKCNLFVEKIVLTEELKDNCPNMFNNVTNLFDGIEVEIIPHISFKSRINSCKGVIRTGEFTAYSNIILVTGAAPERWITY
jgi:D-ribose pyranase